MFKNYDAFYRSKRERYDLKHKLMLIIGCKWQQPSICSQFDVIWSDLKKSSGNKALYIFWTKLFKNGHSERIGILRTLLRSLAYFALAPLCLAPLLLLWSAVPSSALVLYCIVHMWEFQSLFCLVRNCSQWMTNDL